ncbi:MAG TPA: MBL fold metallo-hydrolase, partial [Spirochaetia bacterium]|nr:MBL fold metallo-hydrolase [Spirochaetia bacterium]
TLVLLTHGDSDHAGNAAYLQREYGAKVAIHRDDAGMVEHGDMGWNRKKKPDAMSFIMKLMAFVMQVILKAAAFETFTPDLLVDESFDMSRYGLEASILHLPGHSKGSIGILTPAGALYCGDLLYNMPGFCCIDTLGDFESSVRKLKDRGITTIYPGHGKAFREGRFPRSLTLG